MNALILFDTQFANSQTIAEAASQLMNAHARVRFVQVSAVDTHAFDDITHLVMAYPPRRFDADVQIALDGHIADGMHVVPLADLHRMLWFYTHANVQ